MKGEFRMNMMKKMQFDKKDKDWDVCKFYLIYMHNDIKMIKFIGFTDRQSQGKGYLSWICTYCEESCEMPLEDFLLWDVYYQFSSLMKSCENEDVELNPYECFNQANKWVKGDGSGSWFKKLFDLTENASCGYYYGY